ncbi:hypothetical protein BH11ARM2_BH11ARM2_29060 [soil metagenome]
MTGAVVGRAAQDDCEDWTDEDFREFDQKPEVRESIRSAVRVARLECRGGKVPA